MQDREPQKFEVSELPTDDELLERKQNDRIVPVVYENRKLRDCSKCHGRGYMARTKVVNYHDYLEEDVYHVCKRCNGSGFVIEETIGIKGVKNPVLYIKVLNISREDALKELTKC